MSNIIISGISALLKLPPKFSEVEKKKEREIEKLAQFLPLNASLPYMK